MSVLAQGRLGIPYNCGLVTFLPAVQVRTPPVSAVGTGAAGQDCVLHYTSKSCGAALMEDLERKASRAPGGCTWLCYSILPASPKEPPSPPVTRVPTAEHRLQGKPSPAPPPLTSLKQELPHHVGWSEDNSAFCSVNITQLDNQSTSST